MKFIPERLKSARMMSAMSLQDLADKLKEFGNPISKQAISKYELGDSVPNSEMIGLLSKALNVRPDYFYSDFKIEFSEIEYRKLQSYSSKESQRIIEISRDELRRYLELEELLNIETKFENPLEDYKITDLDSIDNAADKLRDIWKLGRNPIPNVIELLEDHHVKVIELESDVKLDGFSTKANKKYPIIILNRSKLDSKADRKRWTALHELGHIVLDLEKYDEKSREKYCHYFAGALLFPKEIMIKELGEKRSKLSLNELMALKKEYGISMQAIVYRAKDLEIISLGTYKQFFQIFSQLGYRVNEPVEYEGKEESNRFKQLLFRALAEEIISFSKAAALSNQKLSDFRQQNLII